MWNWLFRRKRPEPNREQKLFYTGSSESEPGVTKLGPLIEDMKAKQYRGPFAAMCDGIKTVTFHGPYVPLDPPWVEPADNPFEMRVLDCEEYCRNSLQYAFASSDSADAINAQLTRARTDPRSFGRPEPIKDVQKKDCLLSYPRDVEQIPNGACFEQQTSKDLWNIFLFDGYFYFTRSWTGELRYRSKLLYRPGSLFVTEVEFSRARPFNDLYPHLLDEDLAVRQVDFLIKVLLYRMLSPAPLPRDLPFEKSGALSLFSFLEYGRLGCYPTFDDTTEYRICLNGVKARIPTAPENALLPAIKAVEEEDTPANRERLLKELRGQNLYFAFMVSEEELRKGPLTAGTPIQFFRHVRDGMPCAFAYTDRAFRVERSRVCITYNVGQIWRFVGQEDERTCLVINPGGPASCTIGPAELKALAQ
jgi:hypothetical protein